MDNQVKNIIKYNLKNNKVADNVSGSNTVLKNIDNRKDLGDNEMFMVISALKGIFFKYNNIKIYKDEIFNFIENYKGLLIDKSSFIDIRFDDNINNILFEDLVFALALKYVNIEIIKYFNDKEVLLNEVDEIDIYNFYNLDKNDFEFYVETVRKYNGVVKFKIDSYDFSNALKLLSDAKKILEVFEIDDKDIRNWYHSCFDEDKKIVIEKYAKKKGIDLVNGDFNKDDFFDTNYVEVIKKIQVAMLKLNKTQEKLKNDVNEFERVKGALTNLYSIYKQDIKKIKTLEKIVKELKNDIASIKDFQKNSNFKFSKHVTKQEFSELVKALIDKRDLSEVYFDDLEFTRDFIVSQKDKKNKKIRNALKELYDLSEISDSRILAYIDFIKEQETNGRNN